jgi:phosphotransferase system HPr (HPr) family protein
VSASDTILRASSEVLDLTPIQTARKWAMDVGETISRRTIQIVNTHGLHMRPSSKFVKLASSFQSEILVDFRGSKANGKSILDMTTLAAECGATLVLEARGSDAEEALAALAELVAAGFHMEDESS